MTLFKKKFIALALSSVVLGACLSNGDDAPALSAGDVFVLTSNGQLASFNKSEPSVIRTAVAISGLMAGDTLLGMDFRPRDGQLYALARTSPGNGGRLYTINTTTGVATAGATLFTGMNTALVLNATATSFAIDFNPMADALRVIADTGENLRIFVVDATGRTAGQTTVDGPISDTAADISGAAYTNSFDGTTSTRLLNIDTVGDNLTFQNPPNAGTQVVVAPLGVNATGTAGFDIDARNNVGYALLNVGGSVGFYSIAIPPSPAAVPPSGNAATSLGTLNISGVIGMALAPATAPQAIALDGSSAGSQRLLKFGIRNPNAATATPITGLASGESLLSIDYRPANSTVYGLSSTGKVYTINTETGAASAPVTLNIATNIVNGLMDGKRYQVDFNPMADALRIVSSNGSGTQGENNRIPAARLTPGATNAGVVATDDTALTAGFNIAAIAYTNNFAGPAPTVTQIFNVDAANNRLAQQGNPLATPAVSPNSGVLTEVGPFSTPFNNYGGFDISGGDNGMILMANRVGTTGAYSLFSSALATGPAPATTVAIGAAAVASGDAVIGTGAAASADIRALTIKF